MKEEDFFVKRFIGLLLTLVLCMTCIASAMAVSFSFNSNATTFTRWSDDTTSKGTTWKFSEWTSSNLSDSCQAAVKIYHAPGVYASHTYYYKSKSTAAHNYLDDYADGATVYAAGKKYKGSGKITVSGTFEP